MTPKIVFSHFHDGNDKDHALRGTAVYATQCRIVDLDTGKVITDEWAFCNPKDPPSRAIGREVTLGRIWKNLHAELRAALQPQHDALV